jgi:hypothetical protein
VLEHDWAVHRHVGRRARVCPILMLSGSRRLRGQNFWMPQMVAVAWFTVVGALFILVALSQSRLARLPLSTAMVYLAVGVGLGSSGAGLIDIDPLTQSRLLEHIAEVAVASLYSSALSVTERAGVPFG